MKYLGLTEILEDRMEEGKRHYSEWHGRHACSRTLPPTFYPSAEVVLHRNSEQRLQKWTEVVASILSAKVRV